MKVQPYLHFDGCCEEALEFYCQKLDAKIEMLMHYKDNPETPPRLREGNGNPHL